LRRSSKKAQGRQLGDDRPTALGVADALWRVTGGFGQEGVESAAFIAQHLDRVPGALALTVGQAGDAGGTVVAGAGDVATHLDQLGDRGAGLAHDMNRGFLRPG
jgi:hypothetical protein